MTSRSLFRGVLWTLVALLLLFHIGAGWYFSGELIEDGFIPDPSPIGEPPSGVAVAEVSYPTTLGQMDAWHLPAQGSTWVIHVHGKGSTPAEAQHLFTPLQQAGFPQLAITYRNDAGQPEDPSGYYQYGATEFEEVEAALEFARDNGAEDVVFSAFSTGASHVLAFSYRNNLDVIEGLVFDSPNMDFGDTVSYNASQRELPLLPLNVPPTVTPIAKFMTSLRMGVNWQSIDYVDKAEGSLRVPVLIHHGTEDATVPLEQSLELEEIEPELVQVVQVEGGEHARSFEVDPDGYIDRVLGFLDDVS